MKTQSIYNSPTTINRSKFYTTSFGNNPYPEWKNYGGKILKMKKPELEKMAEYFHKSELDDINAVSKPASQLFSTIRQIIAFDKLLGAVKQVKEYKNALSKEIPNNIERANQIKKAITRMNERAENVQKVFTKK